MKTDTQMDIKEVWIEFHKTRSDHHRNLLMEHYVEHVRYCARMLYPKMSTQVELDDLIGAGTFGLVDAIESYDPERGAKFETFCTPRIRGSMLDELRRTDWVPRGVRSRAHRVEKVKQSFAARVGRRPREDEIEVGLGIDIKEARRTTRDARVSKVISLNAPCSNDDRGNENQESHGLSDKKSPDPLTEAQKRDFKDLLVTYLSRTEQLIISGLGIHKHANGSWPAQHVESSIATSWATSWGSNPWPMLKRFSLPTCIS